MTGKTNGLFECSECHYKYKEKKWAEKCKAYCKKNHACSIKITRHAVKDS